MNALRARLRPFWHLAKFRLQHGSPRHYQRQWEAFWATARDESDLVLWDREPAYAAAHDLQRFRSLINPDLSLVDFGCGTGRQTRFLALWFDHVIGVDIAPAALALARRDTSPLQPIAYELLDVLDPAATAAFHNRYGDVNLYMRGVLHVIAKADRPQFVEGLRTLLGKRGVLYLIEVSTRAFWHFLRPSDDSPSGLPKLVHAVMQHGLRPQGFSLREVPRLFPSDHWVVLDQGDASIYTRDARIEQVPAHFVLAYPRDASTT